ncbi:MAG: TonB family protein, partial [Myxococcota bacterium]|nr:TonB family protein [Myxococcota bacterium]
MKLFCPLHHRPVCYILGIGTDLYHILLPMFFILISPFLFAQDPSPEADAPLEESVPSKAKLPSVLYVASVDYPEKQLQEGIGGVVLLQLYLSAEGKVMKADVLDSAEEAFERPAVDAILNYGFTPALDDAGEPVESVIQYRFVFEPQAVPSLVIEGRVLEAGIRKPMPRVEVSAVGPDGKKALVRTDDTGAFRFRGLDNGEWILKAEREAFGFKTRNVTVQEGKVSQLRFFLIRDKAKAALQFDEEILVEERLPSSELTERFLSAKEISFLPGSGGDVVKAVQNLPGISRAPLGIGQLIIRGTAPEDSAFYIDGGNIPNVFHFAGLTTVMNSDIIEEVAFLPGNYSVRYGRQLGGLVDIRTKPGLPNRSRGYLSVDIYQSTLFAEQRVNDTWALSLSGRRSYADFILNPILSGSDISVRAPRYYDLQTRVVYKPSEDEFVDLLFFLSDDQFRFLGKDVEGNEQTGLALGNRFQKIRFRWNKYLRDGWTQETVLVAGPEIQDFEQGASGEAYESLLGVNLRHEYVRLADDVGTMGFRFGLDLYTGQDAFKYDIPSFP